MTARVIPIAVSGDLAQDLPINRECGCSPLDGCCLPPRPRLVTTTEEQQDDPTVSAAPEVEFPAFAFVGAVELDWFQDFLRKVREDKPDGDIFEAFDDAARLVEYHRETVQGLNEARDDIRDLEEAGNFEGVNEIIDEFFPVEEYPEVESLATDDARTFFSKLIDLHIADPLLSVGDAAKQALEGIYGTPEPEETTSPYITLDGKTIAEAVADRLNDLFDHEQADEAANAAFAEAAKANSESLDLCDCPPGMCLADEDANEDLTHLDSIVYVYPDGAEFVIHTPLYRFVLPDGTHCIEAEECGFEIPPGFLAVICHPVNTDDVALAHFNGE